MSVTFVIGRAGSGKTWRCFSRIVEALRADPLGAPIYWVTPRQATFEVERRLTCDSGLAGFCRARVVSFVQLGREILGESGGIDAPQVSAMGRQMILGHLLRRHAGQLLFFKSKERQAGLAAELDATFDELERAGKTAADLSPLLDELSDSGRMDIDHQAFRAKLHDVRLLYEAYNAFLGQDRLDPYRRLQQVREAIGACPFVRGATLYVDGFLEFSDHERKMLAALAAAGAQIEVTLLMDPGSPLLENHHLNPDEMSLFHRTEITYRQLRAVFAEEHVAVNDPVVLTESVRFESPMLQRVEREMFLDAPPAKSAPARKRRGDSTPVDLFGEAAEYDALPRPTALEMKSSVKPGRASAARQGKRDQKLPDDGAVRRIEAPDRAAEVDAVAREIRSRLKAGDRLRDIAVLMRSLESYQQLIASSFLEHGIPYFVDHRRTAAHHPLVQFLRAALHAACFDWNHDAIIALARTGLAGLSLDEADELENYILQHRVRGRQWESPQAWAWRRDLLRASEEAGAEASNPLRIDGLRRRISDGLTPLVKLLAPGKPLSIQAIATEVYALFDRFAVRESMARWMESGEEADEKPANRPGALLEERNEHGQVWNCLNELFQEMVELLGGEAVTPTDFVDIVESGLERFDLGITPQKVDQVLVGPVDRTRCPPVKTVFVLGMNEGEFPAAPRETTVLSDRERRVMGRHKIELDPDGQRRLLDERLLGYVTMAQPSRRLILTRPLGDDAGRSAAPSAFWHRIESLFPDLPAERVAREGSAQVGQIATPRQLVAGLMGWARTLGTKKTGAGEFVACPDARAAGSASGLPDAGDGAADAQPAHLPDGSDSWLALYDWLVTHCEQIPAIHHHQALGWRALAYANEAKVDAAAAGALFSSPLSLTAAQLETVAKCPFRHFVKYGLKLSAREQADVSGADLGQVYHRLLDQLVGASINAARQGISEPLAIAPAAIHEAAGQVARALRGELMLSSARNRYLLQRIERTLEEVIRGQQAMVQRMRYRPAFAGVSFGQGNGSIPALRVSTPGGAELSINGRIDRIDAVPETGAAMIVDYRLGSNTLSLQHVYHGLSLQLLASLLILQAGGEGLGKQKLSPTAAFYLKLLRGYQEVAHPEDALSPDDERYLLADKPRGMFDAAALADLDIWLEQGASLVVQAHVKKDGTLGRPGSTDAADTADFQAVLRMVEQWLGKLGDEILSGNIAIHPYRLRQETPCPSCEYRGICRFETPTNRYRHLDSIGRGQVLEQLGGNGHAR